MNKSNFYTKFRNIYRKYISDNKYIFYPLVFMLSIIGYLYLKLVILTSKINYSLPQENFKKGNYIIAFWHGRLISSLLLRKYFENAYVLVSPSRSALLIKLICRYFGVKVIEGSSHQGGRESIRHILKKLKKENTVFAITPDGSVGPRMQCSSGVANLAILAKLNILTMSYSCKYSKILNTWDKLMIPFPFNNIIASVDNIIPYKDILNQKRRDIEEIRQEIETILNNRLWKLDKEYNIPKIMPSETGRKGIKVKIKHQSSAKNN